MSQIYPCDVLPWTGAPNSAKLCAQEKFDGWRGLLAFGGGEPTTLTGRTAGVDWVAHVPHLAPVGYTGQRVVVDGEILPPEGFSVQAMQSILGGSVAAGRAWQRKHGLARFVAFDLADDKAINMQGGGSVSGASFATRDYFLSGLSDFLTVAPVRSDISAFYAEVVARGGEGIVIRDLATPYGSGVWKRKPVETIDAVVTHFGPGCSVAHVAFNGGTARVAIPSAVERKDIARDPSRFIGKCLEFQAFGDTDAGKKRSPKFLRWRFDKPARG